MTPRSLFGYDILSEIGQGAASHIYAVTDPKTHQLYALKHVIRKVEKDQRYIQQVQNEYEVSKAVTHPVLRKCYDLKQVKKFFGPITEVALIMELIDGICYDEKGLTDVRTILEMFIKLADALWEVNKAGYVHCDTKPGNILVQSDGAVRLIDLGQACKVGTTKERVQGTPSFIAPEQARCKPLTEQTDVYNFGATLYWALTHTRVPTLLTVEKSDRRIVKEQDYPSPLQLNDKVSPSLSDLVMHCLRLRPYERVNGMGSVLMRLEDARNTIRD
ncbi:MAG TPA: serine/threonine-protein kinase [Tepidisphaeraceae bacterium]